MPEGSNLSDLQTQPHANILNMTLGELLNHNPTAQNIIMQSMGLKQNQFQQMLNSASNNQMLSMTISDLFKNGTVAQAMQLNPQQITQNPQGQVIPTQSIAIGKVDPTTGQMNPLAQSDTQQLQQIPNLSIPPKQSILQRLINLFH